MALYQAANYGLGSSIEANRPSNFIIYSADLTQALGNTVGTHKAFNTSGLVRVRVIPVVIQDLNSGGGAATIQFGITGETNKLIPNTACTLLDVGEMWLTTTPAKTSPYPAVLDLIISMPHSIGYEILVEAMTAGRIDFLCWWEPLDKAGLVTIGDGGEM